MFAQTQPVEQRNRIRRKDLAAGLPETDREQDRNQPAHDMGVTVAGEMQHGLFGIESSTEVTEPDLAGTALDLVPSQR